MYSESSATIGEYLQTQTGKRNLLLAIGIFVLGLAIFDSFGAGTEFPLFVFIALCATAAFINLWREAIVFLLLSYLTWEFVILSLWRALGGVEVAPFVAMLALLILGYGFLLGEIFSPRQEHLEQMDSIDSEGLHARLIYPGRRLRHFLVPIISLRTYSRVPAFFSGHAEQEVPRSRFDVSFEKTTELYTEPEMPQPEEAEAEAEKQPEESQRTTRPVTSAPVAGSVLYAYTFLLEFVGAVARTIVTAIIATIALFPVYFLIFSINTSAYYRGNFGTNFDGGAWLRENTIICMTISLVIGAVFGFWPIVASLFHLLVPVTRSGSGPLERDTLGAREPTRDEMEKIIDTIQHIQATSGKTIKKGAPSEWLVLDEPFPDSYTIGSTVYLTRAAIESDYLPGIMAHEMGHVAHKDGDLLLSIRRFIVPLAYWVGIDRQATAAGAILGTGMTAHVSRAQTEDEKIFFRFQALKIKLWLAFWFGGLGLLLLGRAWARFWRYRDFLADNYAVFIGQEDSLMSALEVYRHVDVAQPYLLTNRPYTAERLDRLKG